MTSAAASAQYRAASSTENELPARTSFLSLGRTSRSYGDGGRQEGFTLNPSRRVAAGQARRTFDRDPPYPSRNPSRPDPTTPTRAQQAEEDDMLPPLSDREVIDVTDEDGPLSARSSLGRDISGGLPQDRFQRFNRAASPPARRPIRQQNEPSARISSSSCMGSQTSDFRTQPPRTSREPARRSTVPSQPPPGRRSDNARPTSHFQSNVVRKGGDGGIYLGVFDLEETDQDAMPQGPSRGSSHYQRPESSRFSPFNQRCGGFAHRNMLSGRTTVVNQGFGVTSARFGPSYPPPPPPFFSYLHRIDSHHAYDYPWGGLPWCPRSHIVLARQTIFTDISTDSFEQETPSPLNIDLNRGLEIIRQYYDGWNGAYTEALEGDDLTAADRTRIERNLDRLESRRDDAIRQLRDGDQAVMQETLDQIRMDRQMAVDMPVSQIRWATPWIKEVWIEEHGDIPPP